MGDDHDRREWAMHMILVARALERIGDNAVDIGEQVIFVVTGLFSEFSDSSHPLGEPTQPR
jgi:phosphate transport system protein